MNYFDPTKKREAEDFSDALSFLINKKYNENEELVFLCIGSDRATGDCLGPIIGEKVTSMLEEFPNKNFHVYGTLEKPIHAKNLEVTLNYIHFYHPDALIIAIDASLGIVDHVGLITLGEGSLFPGIGVEKNLPAVGDIFITGIVNLSGFGGQMLLQTTHLSLVVKLADFISTGIRTFMQKSEFCTSLKCAE